MLVLESLPRSLFIGRADLDRMPVRLRGQDAVHGLPDGVQVAADKGLLRRAVLVLEARCPMQHFNPSTILGQSEINSPMENYFPYKTKLLGAGSKGAYDTPVII